MRRWVVGLVGVVTLAVSGCTTGSPSPSASSSTGASSVTSSPDASVSADLKPYYDQRPTWSACTTQYGQAQCAWVEAPIDYANPGGARIKLRALKVPAKGSSKGMLFVNPGGPGGSAVTYASAQIVGPYVVSEAVNKDYDIVGVDPRGVGLSQPVNCFDGAQMDTYMGADPTPDDAAERTAMATLAKQFGAACQAKNPDIVGHVSTIEAAKDMDVIRAAFGQDKLNWMGKSYGTYLGATYAELFPQRVGRMLLDGAIAPDLTDVQINLGQAEGFERATRAYVASCVAEGNCPLGTDVEAALAKIRSLLSGLDAKPAPVKGEARVSKLTEGWASYGMARAMYLKELWPELTEALRSLIADNDGTALFEQGAQYADRDDQGKYGSNMMQVISAVNCLDRPATPVTDANRDQLTKDFSAKAPTWGPFMVYAGETCANWPIKPTGSVRTITAAGAGPIVVVGTTRDPATPYEWAVKLADQLESGHLITRDGDGHTGYQMGNSCVDKAVDQYYLAGSVPADGLKC